MKNLLPILFLISFSPLFSQDKMEVIRCEAVNRSSPVTNIHIDDAEQIWVGNHKGLNRVYAPDNGELVNKPASEWSLLQTPDGNADIRLPLSELIGQMGADGQAIANKEDRITCAIYDVSKGDLWVGTAQSGLFQFEIEPSLRLVKQHHSGNSKLSSDQINTLFIDRSARLWIGTAEGACYGRYGKWRLEERFFDIRGFAQNSLGEVWVMGNDLLWQVDARQRWNPYDIEEANIVEGSVADIAFDNEDKLWIASEIVAQYDPETEASRIFGPAQEFTSQDVFRITVDSKNVVWIGTNDKGLYIIQKAATLYVSAEITQYVKCNSTANDAAIKVLVDGGTEPYTFAWTNGASGQNPTNLGPGTYELTVKDSRRKTGRAKVTIPDPNIEVSVQVDKPASPDGTNDGAATVNVKGGQPDYTIEWASGETTTSANALAAGEQSVTVKDQAGCSASASFSVDKQIGALSLSIAQTQEIKCAGAAGAALKLEYGGGKEPFAFAWNSPEASGENPSNLSAGNYEVTLTDAVGQSASAKIEVKEPEAVSASIKVNAPASTGNADGQATVSAKGGTGNYDYQWSNGETTAQAVKLGPGEHAVTVTDGVGCTVVSSVNISENILDLKVDISPLAEIKCADGQSAGLQAEVTGGKGPFQFAWEGTAATTKQVNDLGAGNYEVTVTDQTGSTASAKFSVKEPKAISASIKVDAPASTGNEDGQATVKPSGGTGAYTFSWDTGETGETARKLGPGEHVVTVTDAAGCTSTATVSITENILPLSVNISSVEDLKCVGSNDASLLAEVSGGKPSFEYAWSGVTDIAFDATNENASNLSEGEYTVTVTDATGSTASAKYSIKAPKQLEVSAKADAPASTGNADGKASANSKGGTGDINFQWSNGASGESVSGFAPGNYSVTATDENGCSAIASVNISENILPLSVSISQTQNIQCAGEATATLQAEPNGGKPTYTYAWTGGLVGQAPTGLTPGEYSLTITDAEGTTATADIEIVEPKPLSISAKVEAPASTGNADGKANAKANGGAGNFNYQWSNGASGESVGNLAPGNYTVTVSDANQCTATATVDISENILPLSVSISQTQSIQCAGEATATLQAEPSGGKPNYSYAWNGGLQGQAPTGLIPGEYTLTVTDALGTTATSNFKIVEPEPINVELVRNRPTSTVDTENGKATLKANGGTGNFSFKWDNGETTAEVSNLGAGIHEVTVSDENGCEEVVKIETKTRINPELEAGRLRAGQLVKLEKIYFPPDSTTLMAESIPTLDELFEFLEDNPGIVIEVGGHTNGIPSHEFCDELSKERAKAVAQALVDRGLSANRLTYRGYGKRNPVATNKTAEGRAKNQRVEIKIVQLE